jgi:hypothetical protein
VMFDHWRDCVFYIVALLIGAYSGLEDILYYVLDRRPMPESLPWLSGNPLIYDVSRMGVISSVVFWMLVLAGVYFLLFVWRRRPGATSLAGTPRHAGWRPQADIDST